MSKEGENSKSSSPGLYELLERKFGGLLSTIEGKKTPPPQKQMQVNPPSTEELTAESRATAHLFAIAEDLRLFDGHPRHLAIVLAIAETKPTSNSKLEGQRIRVLRSSNPNLVGELGYAFPEKGEDKNQQFVIFKNGDHGIFELAADEGSIGDNQKEVVLPAPATERTALVVKDGQLLEISIPDQISIVIGDIISLTTENQFWSVAKWAAGSGDIVTVEKLLDGAQCVVNAGGAVSRVVSIAASAKNVQVGNRVVLDLAGMIALRNLGNVDIGFQFAKIPTVRWEDIGGQEDAKLALQQAIVDPIKYEAKYKAIGKKPAKGALLLGPPGCGKTMLAEAAATAILELVGGEKFSRLFFTIKATELLRSLVGEGEAVLRHFFAQANAIFDETGIRPTVFIDEIDAIGKKRGTGISSDASETLLLALLTEINDTHTFVMGATNRPRVLDEALTRPGRLTRKIYVGRPDEKVSAEIFQIYLTNVPVNDENPKTLADRISAELFSGKYPLYRLHVVPPEGDPKDVDFGLGDIASGAMIDESLVEEAKLIAITRVKDLSEDPKLRFEDFVEAIQMAHRAEQLLDHEGPLSEYSERAADSTITCTRLYQGRN